MPRFFVPAADSDAQAEYFLQATRQHVQEQLGHRIGDRRIFRLRYGREGRDYVVEVGKVDSRVHEVVIAILEAPDDDLYLVCTASRGVLRGGPMLVGRSEARDVANFGSD